jgi:hypothetical protein
MRAQAREAKLRGMKTWIVALLLLALAPATASAGTIAGKLPKKGKPMTVRVIRADTAEVVAAKRLSSPRYRLKVARGPYLVRGTAGKRAFGSKVVRVGRRSTAKPKLRARSAAGGPRLAIVAVDPHISISGLPGYTNGLEIDGVLITELFGVDCTDGGEVAIVEVRNRDALEREIALQNTKWFDPKTRVRPNFIKPDTFISGHGSVSGGMVTIDLAMRGKVTGSSSVTMPVSQLLDAASAVAADIKGQICRPSETEEPAPPEPPITGARFGYRGSLSGSATITSPAGTTVETWSAEGIRFSRTQPSSDSAPNYQITDGTLDFRVDGTLGGCTFSGSTTIPLNVAEGEAESTLDLAPDDSYFAVGYASPELVATYICPGEDPFTMPYGSITEYLRTDKAFVRRQPAVDGTIAGSAGATKDGKTLSWAWNLKPLI